MYKCWYTERDQRSGNWKALLQDKTHTLIQKSPWLARIVISDNQWKKRKDHQVGRRTGSI